MEITWSPDHCTHLYTLGDRNQKMSGLWSRKQATCRIRQPIGNGLLSVGRLVAWRTVTYTLLAQRDTFPGTSKSKWASTHTPFSRSGVTPWAVLVTFTLKALLCSIHSMNWYIIALICKNLGFLHRPKLAWQNCHQLEASRRKHTKSIRKELVSNQIKQAHSASEARRSHAKLI